MPALWERLLTIALPKAPTRGDLTSQAAKNSIRAPLVRLRRRRQVFLRLRAHPLDELPPSWQVPKIVSPYPQRTHHSSSEAPALPVFPLASFFPTFFFSSLSFASLTTNRNLSISPVHFFNSASLTSISLSFAPNCAESSLNFSSSLGSNSFVFSKYSM